MDKATFLGHLESDYRRLREVAATGLAAKVPSCPEWTMADLVRHTAEVYLHKTEIMRTGEEPKPWPPDLSGEDPVAVLDRAYAGLVAELTARDPGEAALTWYGPDQTVGFWVRRMAQETVIHRVDAELAAGSEITPIPAEFALDGIDEVLVCFLSFGTSNWTEYYGEVLSGCDGRAVLVDAGAAQWTVQLKPAGVEVSKDGENAARISGTPEELLLWLWRRTKTIGREGDEKLIGRLWDLLGVTTQ